MKPSKPLTWERVVERSCYSISPPGEEDAIWILSDDWLNIINEVKDDKFEIYHNFSYDSYLEEPSIRFTARFFAVRYVAEYLQKVIACRRVLTKINPDLIQYAKEWDGTQTAVKRPGE